MAYKVTNLTYSSVRVIVNGSQVIIPGRNDIIENFITVDVLTEDLKTLSQRGLLKIRNVN
jgi:hypothetical protein